MVAHLAWDEGAQFKSDGFDYVKDSLIGRAVED